MILKNGVYGILILAVTACMSDDSSNYMATPAALDIPPFFESSILPPEIPRDNPLTVEGIALGKALFYDPILSADSTQPYAAECRPRNRVPAGAAGTIPRASARAANSSGLRSRSSSSLRLRSRSSSSFT